MNKYEFTGKLWANNVKGGWHLITMPDDISKEIGELHGYKKRSFGSVSVSVRLGKTEWSTSIFYDTKLKAYLLPIKGEVRKKEQISEGDKLDISIRII